MNPRGSARVVPVATAGHVPMGLVGVMSDSFAKRVASLNNNSAAMVSNSNNSPTNNNNLSHRNNSMRGCPQGGQSSSSSSSSSNFALYRATRWRVWLLGLTFAMSGQCFGWNQGYEAGFYGFFLGFLLIGSAYVMLCWCTAEVMSVIPFSNGGYGFMRCTLGFFPGFLVGCLEALQFTLYVSSAIMNLTLILVQNVSGLQGLEPLVWFLLYLVCYVLLSFGGGTRAFWNLITVLSLAAFSLIAVFCGSALSVAEFKNLPLFASPSSSSSSSSSSSTPSSALGSSSGPPMSASGSGASAISASSANSVLGVNESVQQVAFVNGFSGFMKALPHAGWFFIGVESLSLANDQVDKPIRTIPFAQLTSVLTLFASGGLVLFARAAMAPNQVLGMAHVSVPFSLAFQQSLSTKMSLQTASLLSIPEALASAFGLLWCFSKLMASMAEVRLVPHFISTRSARLGVPYVAMLLACCLCFAANALMHYVPKSLKYWSNCCMVGGFVTYVCECMGYLWLKLRCHNLNWKKSTTWRNPLGIYGAIYSLLVWLLAISGVFGFQGNYGVDSFMFLVVLLSFTAVYFGYAHDRERVSNEERRLMLVAQLTRVNNTLVNRFQKYANQSVQTNKQSPLSWLSRRRRESLSTGNSKSRRKSQVDVAPMDPSQPKPPFDVPQQQQEEPEQQQPEPQEPQQLSSEMHNEAIESRKHQSVCGCDRIQLESFNGSFNVKTSDDAVDQQQEDPIGDSPELGADRSREDQERTVVLQ